MSRLRAMRAIGGGPLRLLGALSAALVAAILVVWFIKKAEPADLARRDANELRGVVALIEGRAFDISPDHRPELLRQLGTLRPARSIGWRGESWTYAGRLELHWHDGDHYLLSFATRPSLDGRLVVDLSRAGRFGWWHYSHYDGDELFRWLKRAASESGTAKGRGATE